VAILECFLVKHSQEILGIRELPIVAKRLKFSKGRAFSKRYVLSIEYQAFKI
jgi:hypothetical protein